MMNSKGYTGLGVVFIAGIICGMMMITIAPLITQASPHALPTRPPQPTPVFPTRPATQLPPTPTQETPTPTSTTQPSPTPIPSSEAEEAANDSAAIALYVQLSDKVSVRWTDLWTVVQQQDQEGEWRNVRNWEGTLDTFDENTGVKVWWVSQANFGAGPFRWVVQQGQAGDLLAVSETFHLPTKANETVRIDLALTTERAITVATPSLQPDAYVLSRETMNQRAGRRPVETRHRGMWADNVYKSHAVGTWTVSATYKGQTANVVIQVQAGTLDHIVISPDLATMAAGDTRAFEAEAFDAHDNSLGDVTANTNFSIVEEGHQGAWESNRYTARTAGEWTIKASYNGKEAQAKLKVRAGSLDHIVISSEVMTQTAGLAQVYRAEAFDLYDNSLGDITPSTRFSIIEAGHNGQWNDNVYTPHTAGDWTVRGVYEGLEADTQLVVQGGEIDYLVIAPEEAVVTAGEPQSYEVEAFDAYDNPLGPVTADTTFSISETGHQGQWSDNVYTAHTAGVWTVYGTYQEHTSDVKLTVEPAELSYITISPEKTTIRAGEEQLFAAKGFDAYGNFLGNVSDGSTFSIVQDGHNGRWSGRIYAAYTAGVWTVQGVYRGFTGETELTVEPGELSYIVVTPNTTSVTAGGDQAFSAEAFDAYGNSLGDVTDEATFTIIEED